MERVLVTGATGLVGSYLVVELLKGGGYEVHCTLRSQSSRAKLELLCRQQGVDHSRIKFHTVELEDEDSLVELLEREQFTTLYNCAAVVSLGRGESQQLIRSNVDIVESICAAMRRAIPEALLVHVSSIAAIGKQENSMELITERCEVSHTEELSPYALSKYLSENVVWRASRMGQRVIVVNPSVVLGLSGGGDASIEALFRMVRRGVPLYTSGVMGYVDVRDVAEVVVRLSQSSESHIGSRYIISGYNLTNRELLSELSSAVGSKKPWLSMPKWLLVAALSTLKVLRGRGGQIDPSMVGSLYSQSRYSSEKLLGALEGFEFRTIEQSASTIATRYRG